MPRFTDPEIYAICDDPRHSPDVARERDCSEALIRHIRLSLTYKNAPRPKKMPTWKKGGGRTSLRGEESPQAVLTWAGRLLAASDG